MPVTPVNVPVTIGRIVHVQTHDMDNGTCKPAMVVRVWSPETFNGVMFLDGTNDDRSAGRLTRWVTSVGHRTAGTEPGSTDQYQDWHWPNECPDSA